MSKFVIECPRCGKYAEARTGFFARKRIDCACGNVIHVRTDKISARQCPRCGNTVVFDQSKGDKAACPVCGTAINTLEQQSKFVEFSCAQCGVGLSAPKGEQTHVCPVCDYENNVRERLMAEQIRKEGRASVIKFEGDNESLVWKHPVEDFNFGSQLIVNESQEALFFRDGTAVGPLGPGRYTLETQQVPALEKLSRAAFDGSVTLHSQVFFINKNVQMAIRWGTPEKVRFLDPLTETPLQIGASGEMNVRVQDSRKLLLKLVGTMKGISWQDGAGMASSLQHAFRPMITAVVKSNLPAAIKDNNIDLLEVDEHLELISQRLLEKLRPGFEDYGLTIPQFYVTGVVLPEEDPNFKRIRDLHTIILQNRIIQADADVRTAQANAKAQYRSAEEQSNAVIEAARRDAVLQSQITETELARQQAARQIILAQAEAQAAKLKGMTEAEIMAAKGYSERDLIQADVQKSYAGALGQMGSGTWGPR